MLKNIQICTFFTQAKQSLHKNVQHLHPIQTGRHGQLEDLQSLTKNFHSAIYLCKNNIHMKSSVEAKSKLFAKCRMSLQRIGTEDRDEKL